MARKRKKKRGPHIAPLLLLAAVLLAGVVWAVLPHSKHLPRQRPVRVVYKPQQDVSVRTRTPSPAESVTPQPSPAAEVTAEPSPAPSRSSSGTAPRVAIIIDDCGQWPQTENAYLQLPIPLTLAVLPHVAYTAQIAQAAADAGKGVMLHLPMQPLSHRRAGPGEIDTSMSDADITRRTEDDVSQVPLAQGLNNHEGSEASADSRVMKDVVAVAKSHDLFFVDSRTNVKTVGAGEAAAAGVPTASRDVFLDNRPDVAYTESMLERTVAIAESKGSAIAIGHPKPTTLEALRAMYPRMEAAGVQFVLAKDLVR